VRVYTYVCGYVRVHVCVWSEGDRERQRERDYWHVHVCVWSERDRERQRERETERDREREITGVF